MAKNNHTSWWSRRSDLPPYEVVGPLERVDERDTMASRRELRPGTPHYVAYYSAHPEREKIDARFHLYPTKESQRRKQAAVYRKYPFAVALSFAQSIASYITKQQDEPVAPQRVEIAPDLASENIKGVARYLGADLVGICEINPAWVYSKYGRGEHWGEPIEISHRYAVVIAVARDFDLALASRGYSIAPDIEAEQVNGSQVDLIGLRLASYIRNLGYPALGLYPWGSTRQEGVLIQQAVAVDAGLGEVGRSSLLITREFGPDVVLSVVTTDLPLKVDKPVDLGVEDFCNKCLKCAVCCPMQAIPYGDRKVVRGVKLWPLDAERCHRLRMAVGNSHICMHCVAVCPWTKPRNWLHRTAAELAIHVPVSRRPLVWLDDLLYGRKPRQHPLPAWLDPGKPRSLKQRIITALHKI